MEPQTSTGTAPNNSELSTLLSGSDWAVHDNDQQQGVVDPGAPANTSGDMPPVPPTPALTQVPANTVPPTTETQATEAPTITDTSVTPTLTPTANEQLEGLINDMSGGRFKNADDLKSVFDQVTELDTLKTKYLDLETASKVDPFNGNEFLKGLTDYVNNGGNDISTYVQLNTMDFENLSGEEAVKMKIKFEYPELSESQRQRKFEKEYSTGKKFSDEYIQTLRDDGQEETANQLYQEREDSLIDLTVDGKRAKEYLRTHRKDVSVTDNQKQVEIDRQVELDRSVAWKPELDHMLNNFKDVTIPFANKNGDEASFKFEIPTEHQKILNERLPEIVALNGWEKSHENIKAAKDLLDKMYLSYNTEDIFKAFGNHVANQIDGNWIEGSQQPSPKQLSDAPPAPAKDLQTHLMDQIMQFEHIGPTNKFNG